MSTPEPNIRQRTRPAVADEAPSAVIPAGEYAVGYGRPPPQHRWQKGQSGNPKGKEKGTRNTKTYIQKALSARIRVVEGGRQRKLETRDVLARKLVRRALEGDTKATDTIIRYDTAESSHASGKGTGAPAATAYEIVDADRDIFAEMMGMAREAITREARDAQ